MNVAILGAGAMGNVLAQTVKEQGGQVAGMVEARNGETLAGLEGPVDVVIDFSNPANLDMLIDYCSANNCPAVIATTGFSDEQKALIAYIGA